MYKLRQYQQEAVDATVSHFKKTNDPAVIVLPTGAGKSLVIAELARIARRKILVLTHVKELVEQNHQKFHEYAEQMDVKSGVFSAGLSRKETKYQVTFASVQSVARNLEKFAQQYSLIIIDECHRVSHFEEEFVEENAVDKKSAGETSVKAKSGNQYSQIVGQLKAYNPELKILGLTATPFRLGLGWIYQHHYHGFVRSSQATPFKKCIYELPLSYMIKNGFLTPPKLIDAAVEQYDFSALQSNKFGEFDDAEVNELLGKYPRVTEGIVEQIQLLAQGELHSRDKNNENERVSERKGVMIFAATVKHAKEIVGYLESKNESAVLTNTKTKEQTDEQTSDAVSRVALITAKTKNDERAQLINDFKAQKIKYLVNVSVLTTGFDAPHVDLIAILRPTQSVSLYQQIVGRGLRLAEGKKDCLVIDYAGNGINIFHPEVGEKKPDSRSELVQVFCPSCGFANTFWGITDNDGKVLEHYGRACQGILEMPEEEMLGSSTLDGSMSADLQGSKHKSGREYSSQDNEIMPCDYRFRFKECPTCNAQNDIAARECHDCKNQLVDPDEKLKEALKLSNRMVIRCSGMTFSEHNGALKIVYYDEDGTELKEFFDLSSEKQRSVFNLQFGRRFRNSSEPRNFMSLNEVLKESQGFIIPDFVIAKKDPKRKSKTHIVWQVQDKIFDYKGKYRTANQL